MAERTYWAGVLVDGDYPDTLEVVTVIHLPRLQRLDIVSLRVQLRDARPSVGVEDVEVIRIDAIGSYAVAALQIRKNEVVEFEGRRKKTNLESLFDLLVLDVLLNIIHRSDLNRLEILERFWRLLLVGVDPLVCARGRRRGRCRAHGTTTRCDGRGGSVGLARTYLTMRAVIIIDEQTGGEGESAKKTYVASCSSSFFEVFGFLSTTAFPSSSTSSTRVAATSRFGFSSSSSSSSSSLESSITGRRCFDGVRSDLDDLSGFVSSSPLSQRSMMSGADLDALEEGAGESSSSSSLSIERSRVRCAL
jgi:hypothetical protein